jgi:hypothetical protein
MMNKQEKEAVRLMAMEAYDILDDISSNGTFFTLKNGKDMVAIDEKTYNHLLHLLKLVERAHSEQKLEWFDYGEIPYFSVVPIMKEFNK